MEHIKINQLSQISHFLIGPIDMCKYCKYISPPNFSKIKKTHPDIVNIVILMKLYHNFSQFNPELRALIKMRSLFSPLLPFTVMSSPLMTLTI